MAKTRQDWDYDVETNWDRFRSEMQFDPTEFSSTEDMNEKIDDYLDSLGRDGQGNYGKFGSEGRDLLKERALEEWEGLVRPEDIEQQKLTEAQRQAGVIEERRVGPDVTVVGTTAPRTEPLEGVTIPDVEAPPVGVPTVRAPEEEVVPEDVIETPGGRLNSVINDLRASVNSNASIQRVRGVASNASRRVVDTIENVVSGLRRRLGLR